MDPTPALTAHPNTSTSTGNVFVDAFLVNAGKSARLDSWDEQWSEIEKKFETWWTKYQAWNYDEMSSQDEQKDHDEALRVLRSNLRSVFELERWCLCSQSIYSWNTHEYIVYGSYLKIVLQGFLVKMTHIFEMCMHHCGLYQMIKDQKTTMQEMIHFLISF